MGTRDRNNRMSLLVRNLKFHTSPERLRQIFERYGGIRDVYLPVDYHTKRPKGFGFVEYYSEKDAEAALEGTDQTEVDGNCIEVTHARRGRSSPGAMREREPEDEERQSGRPRHRSRSRNRDGSRGCRSRRSSSYGRRRERSSLRDQRRVRDYSYGDRHHEGRHREHRYREEGYREDRSAPRDYDRRRPRDHLPARDRRRSRTPQGKDDRYDNERPVTSRKRAEDGRAHRSRSVSHDRRSKTSQRSNQQKDDSRPDDITAPDEGAYAAVSDHEAEARDVSRSRSPRC